MTNITYDSEVIQISETQVKFIRDVLEKQGFKDSKVRLELVGKKGDNHMANVVRIIAESEDEKTFKMVAKIAPVSEGFRKGTNSVEIFRNETVMYTEVLPKFLELQKNAGVSKNDQIKFATCYAALSKAPNEVILLEDLKESNFVMLSRFEPMSDECMRLVLKKLATIHSMSFVLKSKEPDTYEALKNKLINTWVLMNSLEVTRVFFEKLSLDIQNLLDNKKYKKIVEDVMSQLQTNAEKLHEHNVKSKYSIIHQGDCWNNNIMFKLENGKPVDAVNVDYQLSWEANPAYDFLYLTFNCSDYETRRKCYVEWVEYYHTKLDESLANFGLTANVLYPRDQFDSDLKRYGRFSMGISFLVFNIVVRESQDTVDMKGNSCDFEKLMEVVTEQLCISTLNEKTVLTYKNKIEGVIDSYIEFGYY